VTTAGEAIDTPVILTDSDVESNSIVPVAPEVPPVTFSPNGLKVPDPLPAPVAVNITPTAFEDAPIDVKFDVPVVTITYCSPAVDAVEAIVKSSAVVIFK